MNCSERVRNCVKRLGIDRIPAGLFGTGWDYQQGLAAYVVCSDVESMYRKLGIDIWHIGGPAYRGPIFKYKNHEFGSPIELFYNEYNPDPPFANLESVEQVEEFPEIHQDYFDYSSYQKDLQAHDDFALCGSFNMALFHNYLYMCGQTDGLCYLKSEPDIAKAAINKITDYWVKTLEWNIQASEGRLVMIENCNDFGTQRGMFISPEDFREFFAPPLKRIYDTAKKYDLLMMQHSCGSICPIIPDFIEMGADILNPIQISAAGMELPELVKKYGDKITFYGGLDTQYLLPQGPESRIEQVTRDTISSFSKSGGFILSGSQGLMNDIPYSHALAMLNPELRTF